MNCVSSEKQKMIIYEYTKHPVSVHSVAKKFGLCDITVSRLLKRNNIKIYKKQDIYNKNLNINFFKTIDNEEKAYFLGLFITDGCVFHTEDGTLAFCIQLQKSDNYMIENIKDIINIDRKIVIDKRDNSSSISVVNDKFVSNLINNGINICKEKRILSHNIPKELLHHFIRGVFDGDGSIYKTVTEQRPNGRWTFCICGHKPFIVDIKSIFECDVLNKNIHLSKSYNGLYDFRIYKRDYIKKIFSWLYQDANTFLKRKFDIFKLILNE